MTDKDFAGITEPEAPTPSPKRKRRLLLRLLLAVVVVGLVAWGAWYWLEGRWYEQTDDAYVDGNVVQVSPQVAGTVISIGVDNGDLVHAGQPLVRLDPSTSEVALEAAKAGLAQAVREVRGLYNSVESAKAQVGARQVAVDKARTDYQRRIGLAKSGAISAEALSHARDALAAAESALTSAKQQYHTRTALVGNAGVAANPGVKVAEAKLRAAWLDHARSTLLAPVDGYVAKRGVQVGEQVQPGMALMAVVPLDAVWVDANFKETQLEHMRIGQPVTLESDLYGGAVTFHGQIAALGIGTGSAFSLLPAQNATGNWIKIVQRVPVRVTLDKAELKKHPLRIGLSMSATVNLHDSSGPMLAQEPHTAVRYSTEVYAAQLAEANALIDKIIQANL